MDSSQRPTDYQLYQRNPHLTRFRVFSSERVMDARPRPITGERVTIERHSTRRFTRQRDQVPTNKKRASRSDGNRVTNVLMFC